jgi:quercetin dioxygenase-like cupin family protein
MAMRKWITGTLGALLLGSVTAALGIGSGRNPVRTKATGTEPEAKVEHFDAATVEKAFATGKPLLDDSGGRNFKVMGLRRDGPGVVEVHNTDTDIFYVVAGDATFLTGGKLAGGQHTAPDEIRGGTLVGAETRHVTKGDVIVIPKGVPHWFKEVPSSIEYFVVKVR